MADMFACPHIYRCRGLFFIAGGRSAGRPVVIIENHCTATTGFTAKENRLGHAAADGTPQETASHLATVKPPSTLSETAWAPKTPYRTCSSNQEISLFSMHPQNSETHCDGYTRDGQLGDGLDWLCQFNGHDAHKKEQEEGNWT